MSFIALKTQRLQLRDHLQEDLCSHHALMSDPEVMRYLKDIWTPTLEEAKANLQAALEQIEHPQRTLYFFRIELKSGEHVGEIGYTVDQFTPYGALAHLGYFTHRRFWGNGIVTEALTEVMRFAFEENGVHRLGAGCALPNGASERVMQKCGMTKEAHYKQFSCLEGELIDRVEYRMLRDEWLQKRAKGGQFDGI